MKAALSHAPGAPQGERPLAVLLISGGSAGDHRPGIVVAAVDHPQGREDALGDQFAVGLAAPPFSRIAPSRT